MSSAYLVYYPSISDHKLLVVCCKKTTTDESFFFFFYQKKNLLGEISINVLNLRKKFLITINLIIHSEELGNGDLSSDSITEKFINTTNSIAKDFTYYIFNIK